MVESFDDFVEAFPLFSPRRHRISREILPFPHQPSLAHNLRRSSSEKKFRKEVPREVTDYEPVVIDRLISVLGGRSAPLGLSSARLPCTRSGEEKVKAETVAQQINGVQNVRLGERKENGNGWKKRESKN